MDGRGTVVIAAAGVNFRGVAQAALSHRFRVRFLERSGADVLRAAAGADVLILEYGKYIAEGVRLFRRVHEQHPSTRVVLALDPLPAELASELILCGVADLIVLPADPAVLLRKAVRAFTGAAWPAIPVPGLAESPPALAPRPMAEGERGESRRAFRVSPSGQRQASLVVASGSIGLRFPVRDLSIGMDDWPGGVSFFVEQAHRGLPPLDRWGAGYRDKAWIEIAGDPPVPINIQVARVIEDGEQMIIAVQYRTARRSDDAIVRRFWMSEQRAAKRSVSAV